jgi:ribonuclease Z
VPRVRRQAIRRPWLHRVAVAVAIAGLAGCVERQLRAEFTRADRSLLASSALHVVLCGTGTALADPERLGPSTAIVAAGRVFLVDVGPGAWRGADLAGVPIGDLHGVLLTTFLTDDVADLDEAITRSWIAGRSRPLAVYGPPGTAAIARNVVENADWDVRMRMVRHDPRVLDPAIAGAEAQEFVLGGPDGTATVFDVDGLRITAFTVGAVGGVPSVGYRFDYRGRSVVIAGHEKGHPNVRKYAERADLLLHEAAAPPMIQRGIRAMEAYDRPRLASFSREMLHTHASPAEAAEVARDAGVGQLVFTRLYPPPNGFLLRWAFLRGVRSVFPRVVLGSDGMRFRLDPSS